VRDLLNEAEGRALVVPNEHGVDLDRLTRALEQEKDLDRERIEALAGSRPHAVPPSRDERAALR
jgi:hypothetical protein